MGELSLTHWIIILAIMLLFFGPSKLPQLGQSLGKAIKGFKHGLNSDGDEPEAQQEKPSREQISQSVEREAQTVNSEKKEKV